MELSIIFLIGALVMKYEIKMDFYNDWISYLRQTLKEYGYKPAADDQKVSFQYFNFMRRRINPIPRKILISKEFNCPEKLKTGLEIIKEKIIQGEDLYHHLSTNIRNLNYNDLLLNDWGIYHLHLGEKLNKDGFIERNGPLLFVRFDEEYAYFITVMNHGNWTEQEMIRIIHKNWPESIKSFRASNIKSFATPLENEDIKSIRQVHGNTLIEPVPGVLYFPLGMGIVTSGLSIDVVRTSDYYLKLVKDFEKYIKTNISFIEASAKITGVELGDNLIFNLKVEGNSIFAIEENHSIRVNLNLIS